MLSIRHLKMLVGFTLACLAGFTLFWLFQPGGRSLDTLFTEAGLRAALAQWDVADRARHVFATRVLDTAFPVIYGLTTVLVVTRMFQGRLRVGLLALTVIAVAVDFVENSLNLRLLAGEDVFRAHLVATWMKYACLIPPVGWGLWRLFRRPLK